MLDYPSRIKEARLEKGLSAANVAETAGIREATVNQIEEGRYRPSVDLIAKIARALECSVGDLVD